MNTATDARRYGFFQIDNEVIDNYDLSPLAGWLYVVIVRHINSQTHTAFPSLRTLAKKANMTRPTVIKYLEELETKKLIAVERNARTGTKERENNHYTVLPVDKVVKEIDHSGKPDLPQVVNDVDHKNTNIKNTESNTCTDTPTAVGGNDAKKPAQRTPYQMVQDYIVDQWFQGNTTMYGRAGKLAHVVCGTSTAKGYAEYNIQPGMDVAELSRFVMAYLSDKKPGFNLPESPEALNKEIFNWRKKDARIQAPVPTSELSPTALLESAMYGGDS